MRADRLVSVLLLLQARGQVTAAEVAEELEVSERTARRDLEALGMAGVPVYSQRGRGGGWRLVGGARTDLSGLRADEARALFLVAGSAASATPEVRAALRKLLRALPEPFRPTAEAASGAVLVDTRGWGTARDDRPPPAALGDLQRAVVDGVRVELGYTARDGARTTRVVHPLGLAAKRHVWYLVADTDAGLRTFRVDRVGAVRLTGEPVVRPEGFELSAAWDLVRTEVDRRFRAATVQGLVPPEHLDTVRSVLGDRLRIGGLGADGRVEVEVDGSHPMALAGELAGWGRRLEILGPPEVRAELARLAGELDGLYR